MTSTKKAILFCGAVVLSGLIVCIPKFNTLNTEVPDTKKDACVDLIDSLNNIIVDQKDQIDFLREELQFRESEISYWGQKYDSIKQKHK